MATESTAQKKPAVAGKWRWTRRAVQTLFMALFLFLLFHTVQGVAGHFPNDLFFHLDPLTGITSMLAGRTWIPAMALGIITLVSAMVLGRAWCGWVCPMGTVLDWTPSRRDRKKPALSPRWGQVKYFLFFAIIIGAALGSLTLVIFDPITLLFRTLASAILPGLAWAIGGVEGWLYNFGALQPAVAWADGALRGWLLNSQPFFLPNLALLAFFAAVLGLNAARYRFWCRYICPLGGLLGLISRISFIRHRVATGKCVSCRRCAAVCPTGAINPDNEFRVDAAECTICLSCLESCPAKVISLGRAEKTAASPETDKTRRRFLYSLGAALVAAIFLRFFPAAVKQTSAVVRPPGSTDASLTDRCIRCGECMKVCPTGVIQPSPTGGGSKLWTPVLKTRTGYCDYSCNACGAACPTGAIAPLPLEEKRKAVVGVAWIDQTRCITWAEGRDCIVCEEMCPVPEKAIKLGGGGKGRGQGGGRHPQVIEELCTGCGICEHQCPVAGEAAIRVFPPAAA